MCRDATVHQGYDNLMSPEFLCYTLSLTLGLLMIVFALALSNLLRNIEGSKL